jgi:AAA15 family ATPase/GTPase
VGIRHGLNGCHLRSFTAPGTHLTMTKRTKPYLLRASIRPDADVDYDTYPFSIPAVREIGNIDFHPNVTFFVGENGSGKSTVMEGIFLPPFTASRS